MSDSNSSHLQHVFYVHSGITRNISFAYIKSKNIPSNDVVFITNRGYQHEEITNYKHFDISHIQIDINGSAHSITTEINILSGLLKPILETRFIIYTPSTSIFEVQTIFNNTNCQGFYIIEEGNLAYSKVQYLTGKPFGINQISWLFWRVKCIIKSRFKLKGLPFVDKKHLKFKGVIGINYNSFKDIEPCIHLGPPFEKKEGIEDMQIIAFSNAINQNDIEIESFILGLKKIIDTISIHSKKVHYKWHPGFYNSPKLITQFEEIFAEYVDLQFVELSEKHSLEEIAVSSKSIFYSDYSSILIYASNSGCEAYSISRLLKGNWPTDAIWKRYHKAVLAQIKFL